MEPFNFSFSCSTCHMHFYVDLVEEPQQIICPNNHILGIWSQAEPLPPRPCKICGYMLPLRHVRIRHDLQSPSGKQLRVEGTPDEINATLEHMLSHPKVLEAVRKAGIYKVTPFFSIGVITCSSPSKKRKKMTMAKKKSSSES